MSETDNDERRDLASAKRDEALDAVARLSPGKQLRRSREAQALTQQQVAETLHLTVHYINALEEDNYHKLPGKTFVRGYLRNYAGLLGLSAEEILSSHERYVLANGGDKDEQEAIRRVRRNNDQNIFWLVVAGLLIAAVIGLSWWFLGRGQTGQSATISSPSSVRSAAANSRNATRNEPSLSRSPEAAAPVAPAPRLVPQERPGDLADNDRRASPERERAEEDQVLIGMDEAMAPEDTAGSEELSAQPETVNAQLGEDAVAPDTFSAEAGDALSASPAPSGPSESDMAETGDEPAPPAQALTTQVERGDEGRIITLSSGNPGDTTVDVLDVRMFGDSWIEVDNGSDVQIFHDLLRQGDRLQIRASAPFNILIRDAEQVDLLFNQQTVLLDSHLRADNSARILLEP